MTRSTRRVIFIIATLIFLLAGYVAVLYAQGYRYNFAQAKFSRTGAISIHANTQAEVLVNGVLKDNTSFLTNSASVSGLLPGAYTLNVRKEGYSKWQKKVTIQEGFVQDFPHIILLPMTGEAHENVVKEIQNLLHPIIPTPSPLGSGSSATKSPRPSHTPTASVGASPSPTPDSSAPFYIDKGILYVNSSDGDGPTSIASGVTQAYSSEDNQKLIWFIGNQIWLYWLNDQNEQPFNKAGTISIIGKFNQSIKAIAWFRGNAHVAADVNGTIKVLELDTRGGQNIISL